MRQRFRLLSEVASCVGWEWPDGMMDVSPAHGWLYVCDNEEETFGTLNPLTGKRKRRGYHFTIDQWLDRFNQSVSWNGDSLTLAHFSRDVNGTLIGTVSSEHAKLYARVRRQDPLVKEMDHQAHHRHQVDKDGAGYADYVQYQRDFREENREKLREYDRQRNQTPQRSEWKAQYGKKYNAENRDKIANQRRSKNAQLWTNGQETLKWSTLQGRWHVQDIKDAGWHPVE